MTYQLLAVALATSLLPVSALAQSKTAKGATSADGVVLIKSITASSTLRGTKPWAGVLSNMKHWCEGRRGNGIGQSITITFARTESITAVRFRGIAAVPTQRDKHYNKVDRVKATADGHALKFSDDDNSFAVPTKRVRKLRIAIAKLDSGYKGRHSCLSRIHFYRGERELIPVIAVPARALKRLAPAVKSVFRAAKTCNARGLRRHVKRPLLVAEYSGYAEVEDPPRRTWLRNRRRLRAFCKSGDLPRKGMQHMAMGGLPPSAAKALTKLGAGDHPRHILVDGFEMSQSWAMEWRYGRWRLAEVHVSYDEEIQKLARPPMGKSRKGSKSGRDPLEELLGSPRKKKK